MYMRKPSPTEILLFTPSSHPRLYVTLFSVHLYSNPALAIHPPPSRHPSPPPITHPPLPHTSPTTQPPSTNTVSEPVRPCTNPSYSTNTKQLSCPCRQADTDVPTTPTAHLVQCRCAILRDPSVRPRTRSATMEVPPFAWLWEHVAMADAPPRPARRSLPGHPHARAPATGTALLPSATTRTADAGRRLLLARCTLSRDWFIVHRDSSWPTAASKLAAPWPRLHIPSLCPSADPVAKPPPVAPTSFSATAASPRCPCTSLR
ncbi:pollen-specific leucine-rich repeat extensin-like protein 4 [Iris pallida]|uniref:Pollen-specific leucine-rich repeat extensin-like protein 4 n=1 Tax=Iris pallida TaxID=29817 RepID=A0AAX6HKL6_IRIPA|nr:pollen-specific leucine-rich repeat extensin-like protein 4 [Iris pallida]